MDAASIEISRYRQAEQLFGWFLPRLTKETVDEMLGLLRASKRLTTVVEQFQVDGRRPYRLRRLAEDLAAALMVYKTLEGYEPHPTERTGTVGSMRKHLLAWRTRIQDHSQQALVDNGGRHFSAQSLTGLASLELYLAALVDNALDRSPLAPGTTQQRVRQRMQSVVTDTIAMMRIKMLLGKPTRVPPFVALMGEFQQLMARACEEMDEDAPRVDDDPDLGIIRGRMQTDHLAAEIIKVLAMAFRDTDEQKLLADTALVLQGQFEHMMANEHGHLRDLLTPDADEAFLWSLCLVVDAWKPRTKTIGAAGGVKAYAESSVPALAKDLLSAAGLRGGVDQRDETSFAGRMRRIAAAFIEHGQISGPVGTMLGNRRICGHELGEFVPDEHDVGVLLPTEAEAVRRHGIAVPDAAVRARTVRTRFNTPS